MTLSPRAEYLILRGALLAVWVVPVWVTTLLNPPPPPPTGMVLQLLTESAQRAYVLAERGGGLEERCETASRVSELYQHSTDGPKARQWAGTAKAECKRWKDWWNLVFNH